MSEVLPAEIHLHKLGARDARVPLRELCSLDRCREEVVLVRLWPEPAGQTIQAILSAPDPLQPSAF